jgi:cytochrome c biogenesis protein CcdA
MVCFNDTRSFSTISKRFLIYLYVSILANQFFNNILKETCYFKLTTNDEEHKMFDSISLAFIEGIGLVASPCILPILPLILATGINGSRKKPFGIVTGFVVFFTVVTLFSRRLITLTGIDPELLRQVAAIFLVVFGLIL